MGKPKFYVLWFSGMVFILIIISCNQQPADIAKPQPVALPEVKDTAKPAVANQKDSSVNSNTTVGPNTKTALKEFAPQYLDEKSSFTSTPVYDSATKWGYNIYMGDKLLVKQRNIPAIQGMMGFATEEKAKKVGAFVAWKASNNIFPPTVTKQELDSLGVL